MTPVLISISEVAVRLSVSEKTVRRLIARGELPAVRIGALIRVPVESIDTLGRPLAVAAS
jgi:excisionase family DNA binding protein